MLGNCGGESAGMSYLGPVLKNLECPPEKFIPNMINKCKVLNL